MLTSFVGENSAPLWGVKAKPRPLGVDYLLTPHQTRHRAPLEVQKPDHMKKLSLFETHVTMRR